MNEPTPQQAAAENYRRRVALAMTPEQRIERCEALTRQAFALLRGNPQAYQAFLRRNFKARRHVDDPTGMP